MKFYNAIVRTPCRAMVNGLSSADLGIPDYKKALEQHKKYIEALEQCGVDMTILETDEKFHPSIPLFQGFVKRKNACFAK